MHVILHIKKTKLFASPGNIYSRFTLEVVSFPVILLICTSCFYAACKTNAQYVCFCVFSGGRNIVVTGSGFDLIQNAIMKVQGDNSSTVEVSINVTYQRSSL